MPKKNTTIYNIKITNWLKYNGKPRLKSYRSVLISERFLDDVKIQQLTPCEILLFLTCILNASQSSSGCIQLSTKLMSSQCRLRANLVPNGLQRLQQLRMVTYEKMTSLYNLNENENININENINSSVVTDAPAGAVVCSDFNDDDFEPKKKKRPDPSVNRPTWEAYREAMLKRWKVEVVRNAKINSNIAGFVSRVGIEDAPEIIKFFVNHNDSFYVKKTHDIGLALKDAESLRIQWLRGKPITQNDVRNFERGSSYQDQYEKIQRGEI
jgi:hypothetical protein